jgi:predicted ester cyclase
MSTETNKETIRRFVDAVNEGNLDVLDDILASDFNDHQPLPPGLPPGLPRGRAGLKAFFNAQRAAFPDINVTIDDITADGDKVWDRLTVRGTNTGPLMGMPPTGKQVTCEVFDISRFAGDKVVEHWGVADNLGVMQQLGVVPAPAQIASARS